MASGTNNPVTPESQGSQSPGNNSILKQLSSLSADDLQGQTPPSQAVVDWLHGKASTTQVSTDVHHFIGFQDNDVAAGSHTHDGKNSQFIVGTKVTLTDLSASPTTPQIVAAVNAINAIFRQYFGTN